MSSVDRYRNECHQIWLNVASSTCALKGFVNLDNHIFLRISRLPLSVSVLFGEKHQQYINAYRKANQIAPIYSHDCRRLLPFDKNTVDHILCSHFLEHVYPNECESILRDFHRVLKDGATVHIVVPNIAIQVADYVRRRDSGDSKAADQFVKETLLTTEQRGGLKYRFLEAWGAFGLQHRWMYDSESMTARVRNAGFNVITDNETPSRAFRQGDDSVHVVARKPLRI